MEVKLKKCSKCNEIKEINCFYPDKRNSSGLKYQCKFCHNKYIMNFQKKYPEKKLLSIKKWRDKNKEKTSKYNKQYREKNLEKIKQILCLYREKNREYLNKKNKIRQKEYSKIIHSSYIRKIICSNSTLKANDIPDNVIDTYRELLKLKREIKNAKPSKYG